MFLDTRKYEYTLLVSCIIHNLKHQTYTTGLNMIPENITKEHLLAAIEAINETGIQKGRHSSTYDLIYNDNPYPPKLVISIANKFANGTELDANSFEGGKGTKAFDFLENEGFQIVLKKDPVKKLIEDYKRRISSSFLKDEVYKWELISQHKSRPNTSALDFYQEIKDIKFKNLVYAMGIAVIHQLAKERPEELRSLFIELFDESRDLNTRIKRFNTSTLKIYRELGETLQHHQDERSIATYLTYHNPEKYTFYKSSVYKKYCSIAGVKVAGKNEKYPHYLELIHSLINNYIKPDKELVEQVKNLIPDFYDGSNHLLLAQDILYQSSRNVTDISYWVFQGNPKVYDFEAALSQNILVDWTVSAHKDKIKIGDKVILWITGKQAGCYALAEVTSEPYIKSLSPDEHLWKAENKNLLKVDLKIIHDLVSRPVLKSDIVKSDVLKQLNVGKQGTNFKATKKEYMAIVELTQINLGPKYWLYAPGENASLWEDFYEQGVMGLGWDKLGDLSLLGDAADILKTIRDTYNRKGKPTNDALANLEFRDVISVGDIIIPKRGRQEYLGYGIVTSAYYYDTNKETYQKSRRVNWKKKGVWEERDGTIVLKTLTDITKYPDYVKQLIKLIGIESDEVVNNTNNSKMNLSLNTILYGPPGTGKTHILKNQYMDLFTTTELSITRKEYIREVIQNCTWWEVIALTILGTSKTNVADIVNHEYIQIKRQLSNSNTIRQTIWGQLQSHTIEECENVKYQNRISPLIFNKRENAEWEISYKDLEEQAPEILELKSKLDDFDSVPNKRIERFEFLTFHQSYSYEDFIEGIKPNLSGNDISYTIEEGVFQKMCNRARNDSSNNYAIFIDEINRGNISSIFGELITLIEDDKREGSRNEIKAKLPYSQKLFSVPRNLYIIGTMNTADRSVEALDTALRRRFSFVEMNPEPSKLNSSEFNCEGINLEALLSAINSRIEKLLDKDYCIGHSYFMTIDNRQDPLNEIKVIFQNKILPLLQEYFYGDWGKIMLVLGGEFVEVKKNSVKFLATNSYEDFEEYEDKSVYDFRQSSGWTIDSFKSIYE